MNIQNINKIITHNGVHHADEVSAISLFILALSKIYKKVTFYEDKLWLEWEDKYRTISVERKPFVTQEELDDDSILILDIGKHFNPSKNNLDHHQNSECPASNILILSSLEDYFTDFEFGKLLEKCHHISDIDLGLIKKDESGFSFSFMIGLFDFNEALDFSNKVFTALYKSIQEQEKQELLYSELYNSEHPRILVNLTDTHLVNWREKGYKFCITKSLRNETEFNLTSYSSDELPIPSNPNQIFLHNSGFMAVYNSFESALNHAKELV